MHARSTHVLGENDTFATISFSVELSRHSFMLAPGEHAVFAILKVHEQNVSPQHAVCSLSLAVCQCTIRNDLHTGLFDTHFQQLPHFIHRSISLERLGRFHKLRLHLLHWFQRLWMPR
jgi:hypothetical protein